MRDLVAHGVTQPRLQHLVVVDGGGVNLHLDIAPSHHLLHTGGRLGLHGLGSGDALSAELALLGLLLLDPLILLLLLLPLLLSDLGLHLRPEVVDHLLLVLLVHVEEGGGRVVPGPEQQRFAACKIRSLSEEI